MSRYDHSDDPALWDKRIHGSADPGRPTNVHLRVDGWPLLSSGYPRIEHITADVAKASNAEARSTVVHFDHVSDMSLWDKRIHASADPGRPTNVHLRVDGWPNQQFALLFVDWLAANRDVRDDYLAVKRAAQSGATNSAHYAQAKEPWFSDAYRRAWEWADSTGWRA